MGFKARLMTRYASGDKKAVRRVSRKMRVQAARGALKRGVPVLNGSTGQGKRK